MRAPQKETLADYLVALAEFFADSDHARGRCECGSRLVSTPCAISLHVLEFQGSCTGPGAVATVLLPYCMKCEAAPVAGCLHLPYIQTHPEHAIALRLQSMIPDSLADLPPIE